MFATAETNATGLPARMKALATEVANTTYRPRRRIRALHQGAGADHERSGAPRRSVRRAHYSADQAIFVDERAVSAYKSTQAFIEQQVAIWTKSDS